MKAIMSTKQPTLRVELFALACLVGTLLLTVSRIAWNSTYEQSHHQKHAIDKFKNPIAEILRYNREPRTMPSCATDRAKTFLVIFLSRSGSTAICSELKTHPEVHMELLELLDKQRVPHTNVTLAITRTRQFFQRGLSAGKVPGFKIRAQHILADPEAWAELVTEFETRVIWQYRKNVVKSVIGTYLLAKFGDNTAISGIRRMDATADRCLLGVGCSFRIDDYALFHELLKRRVWGEEQVMRAVQKLNGNRDCALELPYEDYLHNSESTMSAVQQFLGLSSHHTTADRVKATGDNLCVVVENFDDLCDRFYGCAVWQPFFEDHVNNCRCSRISRLSSDFCTTV